MPSISRRHALRRGAAAAATGGIAALAGCGGMPSDAVIATDAATDGTTADATPTPADGDGEVTVVRVEEIPDLQASIAKTAVRERVYHVCDPSDAVSALASRFRPQNSYIGMGGEYYPVYARVADQIFAASADAPDTDNCGLL